MGKYLYIAYSASDHLPVDFDESPSALASRLGYKSVSGMLNRVYYPHSHFRFSKKFPFYVERTLL